MWRHTAILLVYTSAMWRHTATWGIYTSQQQCGATLCHTVSANQNKFDSCHIVATHFRRSVVFGVGFQDELMDLHAVNGFYTKGCWLNICTDRNFSPLP